MSKKEERAFELMSEFGGIAYRQVCEGERPVLGKIFNSRGQESIAHLWIQPRRAPEQNQNLEDEIE